MGAQPLRARTRVRAPALCQPWLRVHICPCAASRCRRWWHDTNHVFIAQQLCVGGELPQWIGRHPQYTEQVAAKVMYDLLQALTYCHSEGVVHRDVKPQNLLFTSHAPDAYLKLADWGLATKWAAGEDMLSEYCGTLDLCATPLAISLT